ncbi:DUF91 domain-containing protein [Planctomycetota bacterium]|nr:DUF91 domain-containing protein [Planctomycetota bacterium]
MMPTYAKTTRELMYEYIEVKGIQKGDVILRSDIVAWFNTNYPKTKPGTITGHLTRMTTNAPSRLHHSLMNGDSLFYQIDKGRYVLYEASVHPEPITPENEKNAQELEEEKIVEREEQRHSEFAYERDLQSFLAKNLSVIEPGLILYEDEGINGIEYDAGGRRIDILAVDRDNHLVVIELKVSRGYDRVIGQLLRYVNWVKKNVAEAGQNVRGVIISREISNDLLIACEELNHISLYEYEMSVRLKCVNHELATV